MNIWLIFSIVQQILISFDHIINIRGSYMSHKKRINTSTVFILLRLQQTLTNTNEWN